MGKEVFAFMPAHGGAEQESLLLARSLRAHGGKLASTPLWVMIPNNGESLSNITRKQLSDLGARLIPFPIPEKMLSFPFGGKVYASAAAETMAADVNADLLVWMDSDTVFVQEPREFMLPEGKDLGYRPVVLKNISSIYDEPLNRFWELVYQSCGTPPDHVFPMLTLGDGVRIRAQFNAGLLVVRPGKGLLRNWQKNSTDLYEHPELIRYYRQDDLFAIFIHQAVLSATLLAMLEEGQTLDLGNRVNYYLAYQSYTRKKGLGALNDVATFRYDAFEFFQQAGWQEFVTIREPLKGWLETQLSSG